MKAYRDLSKEVGRLNLQELKFPEHYEVGGKETSLAGKMKTRPKHHTAPVSNLDFAKGVTEYMSAKKLRKAASDGTYEEVLNLVRRGANVRKADSKGRTALHFASCKGATDMVELLLSYGASVNDRDCNGSTPLHLACCTNHVGVVTTLLKAGTNVNAMDGRGVTPLHLAYSRLRLARRSDDEGGEALSRKKEIYGIVEMLREFLTITKSDKDETDELEALAGKLTLSDTTEQVDEIQGLLEGFTSLSIQKRHYPAGTQLHNLHVEGDPSNS